MLSETKLQTLGMFIGTELSSVKSLQLTEQRNICMYPKLGTYINITISIVSSPKLDYEISNSNPLPHGSFQLPLFVYLQNLTLKVRKLVLCCCSVIQSYLTVCNPMDCSIPGLCLPYHLQKFAQVHVHCISDAIQPPHPLMSSSLLPSVFPRIRDFSNE